MNKKIIWSIASFLLIITFDVVAQEPDTSLNKSEETSKEIKATGVVVDIDGTPVIGATVILEGTTKGTLTDVEGRFLLNVPEGANLKISYVGKADQIVLSNLDLAITLVDNATELEAVVAVGYGVQRKRDITGSIVSVSGDDIKSSPDYSPIKALQGKVPGLQVTNSGAAGGGASVVIRGNSTLNSGTNPLYVVDGMFVDNIDFINPNDITSIEVLKDPSSLAIFGVQGANGVIIVTTKRAAKDKMSISYDGYVGVQVLSNRDRVKLTNAMQFTNLYNEKLYNENPGNNIWIGDLLGEGTNWQNEIFRPAIITNHGLSLTHSTEKSSSILSMGYFKQDGIVKYDSYNRLNIRFANDYTFNKYVKAGGSATFTRWGSDPATANVKNATQALPTYSPYAPREDWNNENIGSHYTPSPAIQKDVANPTALTEINKGNSESYGYRGIGNLYLEIMPIEGLSLKATGYADIGISYGSQYSPHFNVNNATSNSSHFTNKTSFSRNTGEYTKLQGDILATYSKRIEGHSFSVTAGFTGRIQTSKTFTASIDSLLTPDIWNVPSDFWMLGSGVQTTARVSDSFEEEAFMSGLARFNYSYKSKYLLTATIRADGSSKFSPNKRWGFFPAVGVGWVTSEEDFMKDIKEISFLKVRASWGQLGNDKIGNYLWFPTINPTGQQVIVNGQVYYLPTVSNLVDKNISWEVIEGFDFGIEAKFLDSRLSTELGYFMKTSKNLLSYVSPPASVGAGYAITNIGSIQNQGFEFILTWADKVGKDFSYSVSVNGSTLNNKVLELGNDNSDIFTGAYHRTRVGEALGSYYGYVQDGIFQTQEEVDNFIPTPWDLRPGDIRYKDVDGDGKITTNDRTNIGNSVPKFSFGGSVSIQYKAFDLGVEFNGVIGNKILNLKKLASFTTTNFYESALDRWHGPGTSNKEPILDGTRSHNFLPSTNLLENGSYFRIRNIQLGYTLPNKYAMKAHLSTFRVFANIQNPLTFRSNTGYTPEVGYGGLSGGIDDGGGYPIPTVYTIGVVINY